MNINHRKREDYRRKVMVELQNILNDSSVMPNSDCPDLIVFINELQFGRTVRSIHIDVWGESKNRNEGNRHDSYLKEASAGGVGSYYDLTDMFTDPDLTKIIGEELQIRMKLQYKPEIHRLNV